MEIHINAGRIKTTGTSADNIMGNIRPYQIVAGNGQVDMAEPMAGAGFYDTLPPEYRPDAQDKPFNAFQKADEVTSLNLHYFYDDDAPIEDIEYIVTDSAGAEHKGKLQKGQAYIGGLPVGQCSIDYLGTNAKQEQEIEELRQEFSDSLSAMIDEVKVIAAREDAIFEQESFLSQYFIKAGARLTGIYQGGKSLITGVYDLAALSIEMHGEALSAAHNVITKLASGDIEGLKQDLETLLANSAKELGDLAVAFELMLDIADDSALLKQLATFPYDYLDAHSIVEKERMSGVLAFEILLAVLTAGAGAAVSAASKSKHLLKANKALNKLAKILKRRKLNKKKKPSLIEGPNKDTNVQPKKKVELEEQTKVKPLTMKKHKVACFKKNAKGNAPEYDRQLSGQQAGLNDMTVQEYLDNRKSYAEIGRTGTGGAQRQARSDFQTKLLDKYKKEFIKKGLFGQELLDEAERLAKRDMKTLNALHNPDMIAGGKDEVFDLGDAGVNKSIGSQWKNTGKGKTQTRVELMDIEAKKALETLGPNAKMDVHLHRCK